MTESAPAAVPDELSVGHCTHQGCTATSDGFCALGKGDPAECGSFELDDLDPQDADDTLAGEHPSDLTARQARRRLLAEDANGCT